MCRLMCDLVFLSDHAQLTLPNQHYVAFRGAAFEKAKAVAEEAQRHAGLKGTVEEMRVQATFGEGTVKIRNTAFDAPDGKTMAEEYIMDLREKAAAVQAEALKAGASMAILNSGKWGPVF